MSKKYTGKGDTQVITENKKPRIRKGKNPKLFDEAPSYVSFSAGCTINLGDMSFDKFDFGLTRPCKDTNKEIEKTFKDIIKKVEKQVKKRKGNKAKNNKSKPKDNDDAGLTFLEE